MIRNLDTDGDTEAVAVSNPETARALIKRLAGSLQRLHRDRLAFHDWPESAVARIGTTALAILDISPSSLSARAMACLPLVRKVFSRCDGAWAELVEAAGQHPAAAVAVRCMIIALHCELCGALLAMAECAKVGRIGTNDTLR